MNKNKIIIYSVLLIIITVIVSIIFKTVIMSVNRAEVPFELIYDVASKPEFYVYDKNIYYCTKDTLQIIDSSNTVISTDTYTMSYPYIISNGSIVAVTEENGYEIRVYNENGKLYEISFNDPIISASLNNKGYSCIITKSSNMYKFDLYKFERDSEAKMCIHGEFPAEQGIPFASAIDDNNNLFALSVFDISGVKMKTNVIFYYFNDMDSNAYVDADTDSDCMLTSYTEDEHITGIVNFMDENKFISVSDNKLICSQINISGGEKRKELWSVEFNNEVTAIDFVDKKYIAISYGEKTSSYEECEEADTVVIYDLSGKKIGTFKAEDGIDFISSFESTILCVSGRTIYCIDKFGNELWNYTHKQDILSVYPFVNYKKMFIATDNMAKIYNMPFEENTDAYNENESNIQNTDESDTEEITEKTSISESDITVETTTKSE